MWHDWSLLRQVPRGISITNTSSRCARGMEGSAVKIRNSLGIILTVALLGHGTAQSQSHIDLSGDWVAEWRQANVPNGYARYARFALRQTGSVLSGDLGREKDSLTGSVHDGQIELHYKPTQGAEIVYTGTLKNGEIVARGTAPSDSFIPPSALRAYRDNSSQTTATTHTFEPKAFQRFFASSIPPVLHIAPGDTVRTWTVDAGGS